MLKRLVNEARFRIDLTATGPLLVKSGHATLTGPDMTPVITFRNGVAQVYIPGSSLKGAFRSHVEKIIRTVRPIEVVVSDPFAKTGKDQAAGNWFNDRERDLKREGKSLDNPTVYKDSCPVTRLFGSTWFIGRVSIGDAYLKSEIQPRPTEKRDGVGIDRLTGGAAQGAKFELEVVSAGTVFSTQVLLRNFECWQLGAILLVVQDMEDELIRLGSGKSRGLGAVKADVSDIAVHTFDVADAASVAGKVRGLGSYLNASEGKAYGTNADDELTVEGAPTGDRMGVRNKQVFSGAAMAKLKEMAIQDFVKRMKTYHRYKEPAK